MDEYTDLRRRINSAVRAGETKMLYSRVCSKPDKDGVVEILKKYPVSAISLTRLPLGDTVETFYQLTDGVLAKEARAVLAKEWGIDEK